MSYCSCCGVERDTVTVHDQSCILFKSDDDLRHNRFVCFLKKRHGKLLYPIRINPNPKIWGCYSGWENEREEITIPFPEFALEFSKILTSLDLKRWEVIVRSEDQVWQSIR